MVFGLLFICCFLGSALVYDIVNVVKGGANKAPLMRRLPLEPRQVPKRLKQTVRHLRQEP